MQVRPSSYDYLAPPEKPHTVVLSRVEAMPLVNWAEIHTERGKIWTMLKSPEFEEWIEGLRGDFMFRWIWMTLDELGSGLKIDREYRIYRRRLEQMIEIGKIQSINIPPNHLKRLRFEFDEPIDAIHFKLRWQ